MTRDQIKDGLNTTAHKFKKQLLDLDYIGFDEIKQIATGLGGMTDKQTLPQLGFDSKIKPYENKGFDNPGKLSGRTLEVFLGSAMEKLDPNILNKTHYGSTNTRGEKIPDSVIHLAILKQKQGSIVEDIVMNFFCAKRNASGVGAVALFNGLDTIIEEELKKTGDELVISNELKNIVDIPKLTRDNCGEELRKYYRGLHPVMKNKRVTMYVPYEIWEMYCDWYKDEYTGSTPKDKFEQIVLEGTGGKCVLKPCVSKTGCKFIQISTKANLYYGYGKSEGAGQIEVRRGDDPHLLQFISDMYFGTQWASVDPRALKIGKLAADQWA